MSAGHHHKHDLTSSELDDLLDEALANPKVKRLLAKPFKVVPDRDIPLLGSSAIGWTVIFFDQHLRFRDWPYGVIPVGDRQLDVKPGLTRHERLEPILENLFGWPYGKLAHPVAQHWEERDYIAKGFDPRDVEKAFAPFIRSDEREPLKDVPVDLDLRPALEDAKLLERIRASQEAQKRSQLSVGYTGASKFSDRRCELCAMFVESVYGGPACVGVKSPIEAGGYCRRFRRGWLAAPKS